MDALVESMRRNGVLDASSWSLHGIGAGADDQPYLREHRWAALACTTTFYASASAIYLLMAAGLFSAFRHRKALECKAIMRLYNILQVVTNIYVMYELIGFYLPPNLFGLNLKSEIRVERAVFMHYLLKYADYLDTFFIIVRKKDSQLSFLHLYHHSTISIIWGLLLQIGCAGGTAGFGALCNSFVHAVMYSHYFITSFGIRNPYKVVVTNVQMVQFFTCLGHVPAVILFDAVVPKPVAMIQFVYQSTMVLLFSQFKKRTYGSKARGVVPDCVPRPEQNGKDKKRS